MNPNIKLEYMGEKEINGADIPRADEVLPTNNYFMLKDAAMIPLPDAVRCVWRPR